MSHTPSSDVPGVVMLPPYLFLIALALAIALEFLVPVAFLPAPALTSGLSLLGVLLMVGGYAFAVWGARTFKRAGTNIPPNQPALKLVTHGPYRFTRNPMYIGLLVLLAGVVMAFSLEWGILAWAAFALVLHYGVIVREERYLTEKFGQPYADFLRRTQRYV